MNKLYPLLLVIILSACSNSNDMNGDGGSSGGSDEDNIGVADSVGDEGSSTTANTDLAAHDTDVFDPNSDVTNACSSLLWDSVAGVYEGTVEAYGLTGGSTCTWDVEVTMKRVYEPDTNRSVCNLETTYRSSLLSELNFDTFSDSQCDDVNTSGTISSITSDFMDEELTTGGTVITSFTDEELSSPEWPVALLLELDFEFATPFKLIPLDTDSYISDRMVISTWISVDSSGAMSERLPAPYYASAIRTWDVQRVNRDIAP